MSRGAAARRMRSAGPGAGWPGRLGAVTLLAAVLAGGAAGGLARGAGLGEPAVEAPAVEAPAVEAPAVEAPAVEAPADAAAIGAAAVGGAGRPARAHDAGPRDGAPAGPGIAALFAGERLGYDLSFLFFRRAAVGRLSLEREPAGGPARRYVARLSAETKGFVGWLNRRRHVYTSVLVPCEAGRRFCSRAFVKDIAERDGREVTTTYINPARGLITWITRRDGAAEEIGRDPIPPGARADDMLAALYNFRAGLYGPIERGRRYEIETIPVEGARTFTIRVLDGAEEAEARRKFTLGEGGVVIAVKVPRAIFRNEGEVFVRFSADMVPVAGTVENYIGFGDVHGRLAAAVRPLGPGEGRP